MGVALLVLLLARALTQETLVPAAPDQLLMIEFGSTPQGSMLIDLAITGLCALVFVLGWVMRVPLLGRRWLTGAVGLICLGTLLSCWTASNRRLAIDGGIDYAVLPLAAVALGVSLRQVAVRRLAYAALVATTVVFAGRCWLMQYDELPATRAQYESDKAQYWARKGVALDSVEVRLFESRLYGAGVGGYYPSYPNAAGTLLAAGLVLVAGLALGSRSSKQPQSKPVRSAGSGISKSRTAATRVDQQVQEHTQNPPTVIGSRWGGMGLALILGGVTLGAIQLTAGRAALVSGVLGMLLAYGLHRTGPWLVASRRRYQMVVLAGVGGLVLSGMAVWGHAWYHDRLPERSLTYRWHYAQGTVGVLVDHTARNPGLPIWVSGTGRENFAPFYVRHKRPDSPEEVRSPHNLALQSWAELGMLGLLGTILFWSSVLLIRPWPGNQDATIGMVDVEEQGKAGESVRQELREPKPAMGSRWKMITRAVDWLALGISIWCIHRWLLGLPAENGWAVAVWEDALPGLLWVGAFAVVMTLLASKPTLNLTIPLGVACGVILLSNMADFGLFLSGQASFAMVCAGLLLAERGVGLGDPRGEAPLLYGPGRGAYWVLITLAVVLGVGILGYSSLTRVPAGIRVRQDLQRVHSVPPTELAAEWSREPADPFDPQPDLQRVGWLVQTAQKTYADPQRKILATAGQMADRARRLDPAGTAALRARVQVDSELLAGQNLSRDEGRQVLERMGATARELARRIPASWSGSLQLAEELLSLKTRAQDFFGLAGTQEPVQTQLRELDRLREILARRAVAVEEALRKSGETVQVMNPVQRARARALAGLAASQP